MGVPVIVCPSNTDNAVKAFKDAWDTAVSLNNPVCFLVEPDTLSKPAGGTPFVSPFPGLAPQIVSKFAKNSEILKPYASRRKAIEVISNAVPTINGWVRFCTTVKLHESYMK